MNKQDATPICPVASAQAIIQRRRRKPAILSKLARSRMAEGVGFEPTVGFPTLDFESSALNRTQPPFQKGRRKRRTPNVQHPTPNEKPILPLPWFWAFEDFGLLLSDFGIRILSFAVTSTLWPGLRSSKPTGAWAPKNVTILILPRLHPRLHIVCPKDSQRYYLLLTGIHSLFAPLFRSIRILLRTSTLPHRHDSTKTRNSACIT